MPPIDVRFRRFTSLNTTIRLREGHIKVHLSRHSRRRTRRCAPRHWHILLAKLYRKPIEAAHANRYRRFASSESVVRHSERIRQTRGRKRISTAQGDFYNLDEIFDSLNTRFFHGLMGRPQLTWSEHSARRLLGHYDAAHNTIMVSRVFDRRSTPRYAIEYLMYHEMLHLRHPVKAKNGRRCVHPREFQAEENLFPDLDLAKKYLRTL